MKLSPQHKEILDYITSYVTTMNPSSLNETKVAYLGAFENVMTIWFKEYNTSSKISNSSDNVIQFYKSRLEKIERDLFPAGYVDCPGLEQFSSVPLEVRFSRIEKMLGIMQSPGDIGLDRLENCEYYLKRVHHRLNKLDEEMYPIQKDVEHMRPIKTINGLCKKFEDKLGVNLAFTDLDHRLKHIEDAWNCTKFSNHPYVCPVLKHQQALQDALQDQFQDAFTFGKIYVPKYKAGDVLELNYEHGKETKTINVANLWFKHRKPCYGFTDGSVKECEAVDKDISVYKIASNHVPKYKIGDKLFFKGYNLRIYDIHRNSYVMIDDTKHLHMKCLCKEIDNYEEITPQPFIPDFDC